MQKPTAREKRKMRRKDEREKRFARLRDENGIPHPPRPKETEKTVAIETLQEPNPVVGDDLEKKGWGDGNTPSEAGNIRDESGLMPRRVQAMTARAANWQQQNRFKLDRTAKEIEEIIQSEEATSARLTLCGAVDTNESSIPTISITNPLPTDALFPPPPPSLALPGKARMMSR